MGRRLLSYFAGSLQFLYMETILSSLKRTVSVRSNSDSSESSSPREKRSKSLAEEDEVLQALNMAGNVSEKLDKILGELKKLEKLDAIEATLKDLTSRLGNVESTIDKMKEDARAVESSIKGMDKSLTYLNKEVEELRGTVEDKDKQIGYLHTQHLYLESYSRRENLKFFDIPENEASASEGKDAVGSIDVLCEFLHEVLGFGDPKRNMEFQRVHRIGKSVSGKPRPILARFLRYQDCETVLRAGFGLKDTEYMILQDFPQEIIERRRKQMPKLKEAEKRGQKVSFSKSEPDELFIDGKFISA